MLPLETMRRIVKEKQAQKINGTLIDLYSASLVLAVHEKLDDQNKARLESLPAQKMVAICYQISNSASKRG